MKKLLVLILLLLSSSAYAAQYEYVMKYRVDNIDKAVGTNWTVVKEGSTTVMKNVTAGLTQTAKCDEKGATVEWSMQAQMKPGEKTDLKGYRKENKIYVEGILQNKDFKKVFDIDEKPWYQFIDMQMSPFINADKDYIEYWLVGQKPDFEAFTMSMKKTTKETLTILDKETACQKLEWRMTGLLSLLWSSEYWFRLSDGISMKFQMPGGNDPKVTTELVKEVK